MGAMTSNRGRTGIDVISPARGLGADLGLRNGPAEPAILRKQRRLGRSRALQPRVITAAVVLPGRVARPTRRPRGNAQFLIREQAHRAQPRTRRISVAAQATRVCAGVI